MTIETRFTRAFNLRHPIVCAPMALVTGGALAAAVSRAGGLGIILVAIVGGEAVGLIHDRPPAAHIVDHMSATAAHLLHKAPQWLRQ